MDGRDVLARIDFNSNNNLRVFHPKELMKSPTSPAPYSLVLKRSACEARLIWDGEVAFICQASGGPCMRLPFLAAIACTVGLVGCASPPPVADACARPLHSSIANSCVVADKELWRGARPNPDAAAALVDLGVQTVISLELLQTDVQAFQSAKPMDRTSREIQYFQIRDWEPIVVVAPDVVDDHVAHFLAVTRTQPGPVYVHCRSGQNRTGVMVAAYRIFHGADIEKTIEEMEKYGGFWSPQDAGYIRTLTPQRRSAIEARIAAWIPRLKRSAKVLCSEGKCTVSVDAV
jgi:protein tyrosine phosphatase (PTP) superfamily phosphohydrolase (DUF442 family)